MRLMTDLSERPRVSFLNKKASSGFPRTALMCVELLQQMVVTQLTQQFRGRCIKPV
jgi:hypothetical protein